MDKANKRYTPFTLVDKDLLTTTIIVLQPSQPSPVFDWLLTGCASNARRSSP